MPTAAKLVSAIFFAIAAFVAAHLYGQTTSGVQAPGVLREVSAVVGVLCGWFIMGPQAQRARGQIEAMGTGLRTALTIALVVIVIFAVVEMLDRAIKGRYDTPLDAVLGVFEQALVLAPTLARADVLSVALLGGLFGGALAYRVGRKWT
jgi:hypothetical protein